MSFTACCQVHFWGSKGTTGLAALPLHATTALEIFLFFVQEDTLAAHKFLTDAFDHIFRWHDFLHTQRDPDEDGLVYIRHPWENPLPNMTNLYQATTRAVVNSSIIPRNKTFAMPPEASKLIGWPGAQTYERMLAIAACQKDLGYDEHESRPVWFRLR